MSLSKRIPFASFIQNRYAQNCETSNVYTYVMKLREDADGMLFHLSLSFIIIVCRIDVRSSPIEHLYHLSTSSASLWIIDV